MSKEKKINIIIWALCFLFFFVYSFTIFFAWLPQYLSNGHIIFNWPDANANYFFAQVFSRSNSFTYFEPLNLLTDNLIHSRSINVVDGFLVPMTFLPLLLIFGLFFKLLGGAGILFLTPLLAALSGYFVYRLSRVIFQSTDLGLIITLLFLSLAPWVFFANTVMLPNVAFIFLLLAGWHFIAKSWQKDKYHLYFIFGSLLLSLAVFIRPSEFFWLAFVSLFILYVKRRQLSWSHLLLGLASFLSIFLLFIFLNKATYGGFLAIGYLQLASGELPTELDSSAGGLAGLLQIAFFPFGFDPRLIAVNFYKYFMALSWPHFIFALAGLFLLWKNKASGVWKKYFLLTPFVFFLILLYYASWDLADPLVKELNTISISYVRYFLPLYIWVLPLIAYFIFRLFYAANRFNQAALYLIVAALMLSSLKIAFLSKPDGLVENSRTLQSYSRQFVAVSALIESEAVIISERSDKVFFPAYRVIAPQGDLPLWPRVEKIINQAPIYYYADKSVEQIKFDRQAANQVNLDLEEIAEIEGFRLYKIIEKGE
ncbi:MAG: hypothetical protein PHO91_02085 [Patescibacteria group bacterium]|nr:hypothetical protein [Patescibacteria group bacterium]